MGPRHFIQVVTRDVGQSDYSVQFFFWHQITVLKYPQKTNNNDITSKSFYAFTKFLDI